MTKRDDLQALHDAVKAGTHPGPLALVMGSPRQIDQTQNAYHGSLDAAHALHRAVLPGWAWAIECANAAEVWPLGQLATAHRAYSDEGNPARAWLLAILAALIAMEEE